MKMNKKMTYNYDRKHQSQNQVCDNRDEENAQFKGLIPHYFHLFYIRFTYPSNASQIALRRGILFIRGNYLT